MHGGSVRARSEGPGRGSEFVVRFPAIDGPLPGAPPSSAAAAPGPRGRGLVIEDNAELRHGLRTLLESAGHRVAEAEDAESGLAALEAFDRDAVLVDLGLPGRDGFLVARAARTRARCPTCLATCPGPPEIGHQGDPPRCLPRGLPVPE
jgi:hypothetical protein